MKNKLMRVASRTSLIYWIVAVLWIVFSDRALLLLTSTPGSMVDLSMYKGWAFVTVTAILLYIALRNQLHKWQEEVEKRRQVEDTLKRYEILANQTRDLILFVRKIDGRIVEANPAAVAAYGYTRDEMLSRSINDLRVPGDDNVTFLQMEDADREGTLFETVHVRKDGTAFPVEVSSRGIDIDGSRTLISVIRDISRRKEGQLRFRQLYDAAPVGISNIDSGGMFIRCNPALEKILGYSESELQKMSIDDVTHPEDRIENAAIFRDLVKGRISTGSLEKRYIRKDGRVVWVNLISSGVYDGDGRFLHAVSIAEDITSHKLADEKIKRLSRVYELMSDVNQSIVRVRDRKKLFEEVCRIAVGVGKFKLVWIGVADEKSGDIKPVASSGDDEGFLGLLDISFDPNGPEDKKRIEAAFCEGQHIIRNDIEHDCMECHGMLKPSSGGFDPLPHFRCIGENVPTE